MSEHGTRTRYQYGCRCEACREARATYQRKWYRRRLALEGGYGEPLTYDAAEVTEHLRFLRSAGVPMLRVIDETGLSNMTVYRLLHGHSKFVRRRTWDLILGVTAGDGAKVRLEYRANFSHFDPEAVEIAALTWPLKTCCRCGEKWPANGDYFTRDNSREDGLKSSCKRCDVNAGKDYYRRVREAKKVSP